MFVYEKKLQYPVRIRNCNPRLASVIITQYGGPYINRLYIPSIYRLAGCLKFYHPRFSGAKL